MFLFLILALFTPLALAELPDAGTLLREEQALQPTPLTESPLDTSITHTTPSIEDHQTTEHVLAQQFQFIGNFPKELLPTLHLFTNPQRGKNMTLRDLENLCDRLGLLIQQKGFSVVKVSVPPQEIKNGLITLQVFIAQIDFATKGFDVSVISTKRSNQEKISTLLVNSLCPEKTCTTPIFLESQRLERGILLINDLPGLSGNLLLEPGQRTGTTRIVIQTKEAPLLTGAAALDNYGNPYSGLFRTQGSLFINSPFGWTDQISAQMTLAERLSYAHLQYDFPINAYGTRSQLAYNQLHYSLGKDFTNLEAKGDAETIRATIRHPIVRQRHLQIIGDIHTEKKHFWDYSLGVETSHKNLKSTGLSLTIHQRDQYWGGGINAMSLSMDTGHLNTDQTLAGTAGSFTKWQLSAARTQRLLDHTSSYLSIYGQRSDRNLDSSEKMSLGGPNAVRAYSVNVASGNEGSIATIELHQDLLLFQPTNIQLIAFFDHGILLAPYQTLQGAGLSVQVYHQQRASARFTVAQALDAPTRQIWLQGYVAL